MVSSKDNLIFRKLSVKEIEILKLNNNRSDNWKTIRVKEDFNPEKIQNSTLTGNIQLGSFSNKILENDTLNLPMGIYNSMISDTNIGDNCAIHNARYISSYDIGNCVLIFNVDELSASPESHYGNGYLNNDGSRNWISIINESGSRNILPFNSIETADCHLWAKLRGDKKLQSKFISFTDKIEKSDKSNKKASIGNYSALRSCRIIRDSRFGEFCQIFGVSHLENITVNSSKKIQTVIGEDSDLRNGIVGYGAEIRHGARASDFILANFSSLKYGANFFNSYLGENSTVSCCEVNSTMVLPFHEQHHNNSFLIASLLYGQSNIGAGSTIGSNHNSRSADGEISAGRGFWTALSSSTKHNCSFASFTILAKNDFLHEMKIPTPFSLISLDHHTSYLQIMPAYWFMYNMYALTRNSGKFKKRDKRLDKSILIETDFLAPDTVEEIFNGIEFLENWAAMLSKDGRDPGINLREKGRTILELEKLDPDLLEIDPGVLEYSTNPVRIIKPAKAYKAYKQMLIFYSVKVLCEYAYKNNLSFNKLKMKFKNSKRSKWINVGGQLFQEDDLNTLIGDIKDNRITCWEEVHLRYRKLNDLYIEKKTAHAYASMKDIFSNETFDINNWNDVLKEAKYINKKINNSIFQSRKKDHSNLFRHITFSSSEESEAILGKIENNTFLIEAAKDSAELDKLINKYLVT